MKKGAFYVYIIIVCWAEWAAVAMREGQEFIEEISWVKRSSTDSKPVVVKYSFTSAFSTLSVAWRALASSSGLFKAFAIAKL